MQKIKPIRDRKYLNSYRDASCYACGACDGTVVGAHIRHGHGGGMGLKPGDDVTMPLCSKCHALEGANEAVFWQKVYGGGDVVTLEVAIWLAKKCAELRYAMWKDRQK